MHSQMLKLGFMLLIGITLNCFGLAQNSITPQVLIIDIPRLMFSDITPEYPVLYQLAKYGTVAGMTLPNLEPRTPTKIYLELNSGQPLKVTEDATLMLNVTETYRGTTAGTLYRSFTGIQPRAEGAVNLGQSKLIQLNTATGHHEFIGKMGRAFHSHAYRTAVIGNADIDRENYHRAAAFLLMDEQGMLDWSAIGWDTVMEDANFVFGVRSDPQKILGYWQEFRKHAEVIQIILGDLERINQFRDYLTTDRLEYHRRQVLVHYDQFLQRLLEQVDFQSTLLILMSVVSPDDRNSGAKLSPVIMKKKGLNHGLLYSDSTRRVGIVTGYDVMATILRHMQIKPSGYFKGRALKGETGEWHDAANLQERLVINYNLRWPILTGYGYALIGLIIGFGGILLFFRARRDILKWIIKLYWFLLTMPVVFLILGLFNPVDELTIAITTLAGGSLLAGGAWFVSRKDSARTLAILSGITVAAIVIDGLSNGAAELASFLGYSAVVGARFYGIGNEYLGFLLGAYIVGMTLLLPQYGTLYGKYLWVSTIGMAVFLAHPDLGSNIGGGITALLGLGITNYFWLNRPVRVKELSVLAGSFVLFIIFIGFWDLALHNKTTHFGQFLTTLQYEGWSAFVQVVTRKLALNWKIIQYTPFSKLLIGILAIVPVIYKKPPRVISGWLNHYAIWVRAFLGLAITALIALLVNDSGIVTMATMAIFGFNLAMVLTLKETSSKGVENR